MPQARTRITTSSGPGDGSGTVATEMRGLRQTWFPRRATRADTSVATSVAMASRPGAPSASSFSAFILRLPVIRFELDEFQRVVPRVDGKEARPTGDLPIVVTRCHAGGGEVRSKRADIVDLEAGVTSGLGVHGYPRRFAEQMQLLVADRVPDARPRKDGRARPFLEPEDLAVEAAGLVEGLPRCGEGPGHPLGGQDRRAVWG